MGISYQLKLENFDGPLDLLLHLIDENKMSIYDIKISIITGQYLDYLMEMQQLDMEIASDFLVMAATLLHIKSRSMLPKAKEDVQDSETELIRQLMNKKTKESRPKYLKLCMKKDRKACIPSHQLRISGNLKKHICFQEAFLS